MPKSDCEDQVVPAESIEAKRGVYSPTKNGIGSPVRQKRGDTLVRTLRDTYGPDFAPGVRSDTRLHTLRERTGKSLTEMTKKR